MSPFKETLDPWNGRAQVCKTFDTERDPLRHGREVKILPMTRIIFSVNILIRPVRKQQEQMIVSEQIISQKNNLNG